jgi:hypothetical protein
MRLKLLTRLISSGKSSQKEHQLRRQSQLKVKMPLREKKELKRLQPSSQSNISGLSPTVKPRTCHKSSWA